MGHHPGQTPGDELRWGRGSILRPLASAALCARERTTLWRSPLAR